MRRPRNIWKPVVIAVLVTAVLACLATGAGHSGHSDLAFALLPDAGPLDILPSGPAHWLYTTESLAVKIDPLLSTLPPRGPPA
jgi:hypothetical protein